MSKSELAKFSHYSDEELEAIANQDKKKSTKPINLADYAHMSNEELEAIANQNKNAPGNLVATDTQPWSLTNIINQFGKGFGQGAVDTGTALVNLPKRGVDAAFGKEPDPFTYDIPGQEPHSIPNLLGKGTELGAELLVAPEIKAFQALAAKLAPLFLKAAPRAKEAINSSKLAQLANYAPAAADVGATGAAYGALFGANNPEQTLRESALKGALGSMAIGGAARIPSAFREMDVRQLAQKIKSGKERGRSPAETAKYMEDIQGLPIDIGTAVDNESRFQKYKDLASFTGSGVKQKAAEINAITKTHADKLKKNLIGGADMLGTNDAALAALIADEDKYSSAVSKLFKNFSTLSDQYGIKVPRVQTNKVIKNIIKEHEHTEKVGTFSKFTDSFINELKEKLAGGKTPKVEPPPESPLILPDYLKPEPPLPPKKTKPSVKDIDEERKVFNERAKQHGTDWNRYISGVYKSLEKASINDIEKAITKSKHPELIKEWQTARKTHATKVVPYRKREIENILTGKESSEKLPNVLTKPSNQFVFNSLPKHIQKQIVYRKLNPSGQDISEAQLANRYKVLDANAKKRLMGDAKKEWDTLVKLNDIKQKINPVLEKPNTGFANKESINAIKAIAGGAAAAHTAGLSSGMGMLLGLLGTGGLKRLKANYATSPKTLQAYIDQSAKPSKNTERLSKLTRMLYAENQNR